MFNCFLYSVIIPTKNSPLLLQRCLESIPLRSDIEIIVVDDNSDPDIVDFYNYPGLGRFNTKVIFDKEGKGAGRARNIGLNQAVGKWLLFADSDDFYNKGAFDELDKYSDSDIDILFFNVNSLDSVTLKKSNRDQNFQKYIELFLNGTEPNGESIKFRKWEPWNKMFKRDFIINNHILFEEIPRCNDMSFSLLAGFKAKNIAASIRKLYCVTTNPNSITKSKIKKEVFWYCILCEIKKNYLYQLIDRNTWKSRYFLITLYLLKNNGVFDTFDYFKMLFTRRKEIKEFKLGLKFFFK